MLLDNDSSAFHGDPVFTECLHGFGQQDPLRLLHDPLLQDLGRIIRADFHASLGNDGATVALRADKMHRSAGELILLKNLVEQVVYFLHY